MSNRNRREGHEWERQCVKALKDLYPDIATARLCNRYRDGQKVDLVNKDESISGRLPFNFQCKNLASRVDFVEVLSEMPDIPGISNVILHKKTKKVGTKFVTEGKYAVMYLPDFFELLKELERLKKLEHEKSITD